MYNTAHVHVHTCTQLTITAEHSGSLLLLVVAEPGQEHPLWKAVQVAGLWLQPGHHLPQVARHLAGHAGEHQHLEEGRYANMLICHN